jgi:hypothetical protein
LNGVDPRAMATAAAPRSGDCSRAAAFAENLLAGLRIALFLRVSGGRLHAGAEQLIALVALGLLLNLAAGFAFVGSAGAFNPDALPSAVFGVLLLLLAGWVIARWRAEPRLAAVIPVAVAAAAVSLNLVADGLWLAIDRGWIPMAPEASMRLYYGLFAWWSLATGLAVSRLSRATPPSPVPALLFAMIVLVPTYFVPSGWLWEAAATGEQAAGEGPPHAAVDEDALYAQPELLRRTLARIEPQRPGIADLYFVGFAPYASQDVFMKEVQSVGRLLRERFDVGGREVSLVSHPSLAQDSPIATLTSLRLALAAVGKRIDPEEDVVLLHVTTHGSQNHELSVEFRPLQLAQIRPQDIRAALDDAGIKWRIVVVSACYSGGFLGALAGPTTLVLTAADASHASFGCASDSDYTDFSRALYDEALRKTRSFPQAFVLARESIQRREARGKLEPSNPQMALGARIEAKLAQLSGRLSALDR